MRIPRGSGAGDVADSLNDPLATGGPVYEDCGELRRIIEVSRRTSRERTKRWLGLEWSILNEMQNKE